MIQLPDNLTAWLLQYGSFALFALLALGIFALPIPDETLMVFSGVLISQGKLSALPTLLAAYAGSISGISISYCLGRTAGSYLLHKYGPWLRMSEQRIQRVHNWFERIGKWALLIGYFIPGVRHFTGYVAGTTELHYKRFALFAYTGAIIWVSCFIAAGYFLGNKWLHIVEVAEEQWLNITAVVAIGVLTIAIWWIARWRKKRKMINTT